MVLHLERSKNQAPSLPGAAGAEHPLAMPPQSLSGPSGVGWGGDAHRDRKAGRAAEPC